MVLMFVKICHLLITINATLNIAIVIMCITTIALELKRKKLIEDLQAFQAEHAMNMTVVNAAPATS